MNHHYKTKDWHVGMRGKIYYPGTSLHGKATAALERISKCEDAMPSYKPLENHQDTTQNDKGENITKQIVGESQSIEFTMDKDLLVSVIKNQAGTPQKAISEGVMNAVDAKATELHIDITSTTLCLRDNGIGFENEANIKECFGKFGARQSTAEQTRKTYGQYRMGRGQLFALGTNIWTTGHHQMVVDIEKTGISYQLKNLEKNHQGCLIEIQFYNRFTPADLFEIERELEKAAKYVKTKVYLNGNLISKDPTSEKWDMTTEEAFFNLRARTGRNSIDLYNLGVFVCELPAYKWGTSGVIVSRQRLSVNFARNEVAHDCPVYKKIKKTIEEFVTKTAQKKTVLNPDERCNILRQLASGSAQIYNYTKQALFLDANEHPWSIQSMAKLYRNPSWAKCDDLRIPYCFAESSHQADQALQARKGLILDTLTLRQAGYKGPPENFFKEIGAEPYLKTRLHYMSLEKIQAQINTTNQLVDPQNQTKREKTMLHLATLAQGRLITKLQDLGRNIAPRTLRIGISECAVAWTNGTTYIAFERDFLNRHQFDEKGLATILLTLLHELCHDNESWEKNSHPPEFYKLFHDAADAVPAAANYIYRQHQQNLIQAGKKLSQTERLKELRKKHQEELEPKLALSLNEHA
jgi:hypothetical protein